MGDPIGLVEGAKALSQPICKLVEGICAGCGRVYEPIHVKRMAQARAIELNVIADAMRNNIDVPVLYQEGIVRIDSQDVQNLAQRAAVRVGHQEMTKQLNIEHIVGQAALNLEDTEAVPDTPVDKDWMMRFFNYAGGVNDEDVQKMWAQVLTGKIKHPSFISLRTLDVLRNLSKQDAALFQKVNEIALISLRGPILYSDGDFLQTKGIDVYDIVSLVDAGLLSAEALVQTIPINNDTPITFDNGKYICTIKTNHSQSDQKIKHGFYAFSQAGKELRGVLGLNSSLESFLQIIRNVKKKNPDYVYTVHEVINRDGNIVRYCLHDLFMI